MVSTPTRTCRKPWLDVWAAGANRKDVGTVAGKWLLFVNEDKIDETWAKISQAVRDGRLANYAKTSTAFQQQSCRPYVICVYADDWTNMEDVMAIRERLRVLGFENKIYFKSDKRTMEGGTGSDYSA